MAALIRKARSEDQGEWLRMRLALWPEEPVQELIEDQFVWLREKQCVALVAERTPDKLCGFLEAAIRPCDCDGTVGRFGYVEGWYVDLDVRRQGVGSSLLAAAESWVKNQGCEIMLSDARTENALSQAVHHALGFEEVERLVHFRRRLI